jgi:hypothetical protein
MMAGDKRRFAAAFNRLAVATRLPADEADAVMQQVYWEGLAHFPIEAVEDAVRELATAAWFPKLGEWVAAADRAATTRVLTKALPRPREQPWVEECPICYDTGWEVRICPGDGSCQLAKAAFCVQLGMTHPYTVACGCRETNHTYARKRAEVRTHAVRASRGSGE